MCKEEIKFVLTLIKIYYIKLLILFLLRKYKNKETTVRHELNKLKVEYNDAIKRLNNLEIENRKMVIILIEFQILFSYNFFNLEENKKQFK